MVKFILLTAVTVILMTAETFAQEVSTAEIISIVSQTGMCPDPEEKEMAVNQIKEEVRSILDSYTSTWLTTMQTTTKVTSTVVSTPLEPTTQETNTNPLYSCNGTPGWKQVVFIDMSDTNYNCPPGFNTSLIGKRTCTPQLEPYTFCSSTTFNVGGSEYSQVCGRIKAYQVGDIAAFESSQYISNINSKYVDGVSLTHGPHGNREHIWTFAAGLNKGPTSLYTSEQCICDNSSGAVSPPPFVGSDYFCESGLNTEFVPALHENEFFPDDPLWDGQGCSSSSTCCQLNNPPWFTKNLPNPTTDDIELRSCLSYSYLGDLAIEIIELYVQ